VNGSFTGSNRSWSVKLNLSVCCWASNRLIDDALDSGVGLVSDRIMTSHR
jgi:hypothetical protein